MVINEQIQCTPFIFETGGVDSTSYRRERRHAQRTMKVAQKLTTQVGKSSRKRRKTAPRQQKVSWKQQLRQAMRSNSKLPMHSTSTTKAGCLIPFMYPQEAGFPDSPIIGQTIIGLPYSFDCWRAYDRKAVSSVNGIIVGQMGSGKSMCLKTLACREISNGRKIIIMSDPKGEWVPLAQAVNGQIIRLDEKSGLNPFQQLAGTPPAEMEANRKIMWQTLFEATNHPATPSTRHNTIFDKLVSSTQPQLASVDTTVEDYLAFLQQWLAEDPQCLQDNISLRTEAEDIIILCKALQNNMAGVFSRQTNIDINPITPMLVFDTSSPLLRNPMARRIFNAVMQQIINNILQTTKMAEADSELANVFRLIIADEGWEILSQPQLVAQWDKRLRLSGDLKCSNWLLFHELADIQKYADSDDGLRQQIEGIFRLSEFQIIYKQSEASINLMRSILKDMTDEEASTVRTLNQGWALWRVGEHHRSKVYPIVSDLAYAVMNTDAGRTDTTV